MYYLKSRLKGEHQMRALNIDKKKSDFRTLD